MYVAWLEPEPGGDKIKKNFSTLKKTTDGKVLQSGAFQWSGHGECTDRSFVQIGPAVFAKKAQRTFFTTKIRVSRFSASMLRFMQNALFGGQSACQDGSNEV